MDIQHFPRQLAIQARDARDNRRPFLSKVSVALGSAQVAQHLDSKGLHDVRVEAIAAIRAEQQVIADWQSPVGSLRWLMATDRICVKLEAIADAHDRLYPVLRRAK